MLFLPMDVAVEKIRPEAEKRLIWLDEDYLSERAVMEEVHNAHLYHAEERLVRDRENILRWQYEELEALRGND